MSKVSTGVRRESPIYHIDMSAKKDPLAGVQFKELSYFGHLILRGRSDNPAFVDAIKQVVNLTLPTKPLTSDTNEQALIHWLGPTEWLLLLADGTESEVESALREKLTGHFSIVDVSGGQTLFQLSGDHALMLMKKSCGYDIENELPVGKTVTTHFAKAGAVIHKQSDGVFLIVIRRSFADYVFRWIEDAASEYGLCVN